MPMSPEQAWGYAAEWGSYMTSGDPGACMYGFDEKFRVQSEEHRQNCLTYIKDECEPLVRAHPDWEEYAPDELDKLAELREALLAAPIG